jgi:hypothetical protein
MEAPAVSAASVDSKTGMSVIGTGAVVAAAVGVMVSVTVGVTKAVSVGCSGTMVDSGVAVATAVSVLPVTSTTSATAVVGAGDTGWQATRNQKVVVSKKSVIDKKRFFVYMSSINPPMDTIESLIICAVVQIMGRRELAHKPFRLW